MIRRNVLLALFLSLVVFSLGWQLGTQVTRRQVDIERAQIEAKFGLAGSGVTFAEDPEKEVDMTILWTVWRLLDRNYVEPDALTIDKLRFGAVRGLVEAVGDAYSAFMTPQESTDFQRGLQGKLEGIGAELTMRDGRIVVVSPLPGSPAQKAGLLPLDVITAVDGESLDGVSLQDAVQRIRGERGTEVTLGVFRPSGSEEITVSIVREEIRVPSVEYEIIETGTGTVGYIALNQFGDDTVREARNALKEFAESSLSGVVLDLRFNGGGYLDGSIEVASFFLSKGKVVSVSRRGEEVESHYAFGNPIMPETPLVVLINEGSASASEIVAGALQDHGRATIMGAKSFGKGTVQEVIDLPGGSSLRVTVAKWKTPNGKDLSKEGVTPDIAVAMTTEEIAEDLPAGRQDLPAGRQGADAQKAAAIEWLLDGEERGSGSGSD